MGKGRKGNSQGTGSALRQTQEPIRDQMATGLLNSLNLISPSVKWDNSNAYFVGVDMVSQFTLSIWHSINT